MLFCVRPVPDPKILENGVIDSLTAGGLRVLCEVSVLVEWGGDIAVADALRVGPWVSFLFDSTTEDPNPVLFLPNAFDLLSGAVLDSCRAFPILGETSDAGLPAD